MIEIQTKEHSPFSPLLMEFKMPQEYIDTLNKYGDKISADKKKSEKLDFSDRLVGNVKQEHIIEDHIWQEGKPSMFQWVGGCASLYVQSLLKRNKNSLTFNEQEQSVMDNGIKTLNVLKSWLVNSVAGDFNPVHQHEGRLSCAGWLMMPESIQKDEEREHAGWIEFMYGESLSMLNNKHAIKPEVGQIFMFPSWLQHSVYPFRGDGIRRSISFNLDFTV